MDTRFHCVYLLTSLDPACEGDYYIGYTVNPLRRLRQHNGALVNGARRTKRRGRPWTLVCCVSGFPEDRAALKFEWCWQHPTASSRLKQTAPVLLRGLHKLPFAVGVLHLLVRAQLFSRLELTLHIFDEAIFEGMRALAVTHAVSRVGGGPRHVPRDASSDANAQTDSVHGGGDDPSAADGGGGLPPLQPTELFHVETITPSAFEAKYLSHERGGGLPSSSLLEGNSSCPLDVSTLSQTVRAAAGWHGSDDGDDQFMEGDLGDDDSSSSGGEGGDDLSGYASADGEDDELWCPRPGGIGPPLREGSRSPPLQRRRYNNNHHHHSGSNSRKPDSVNAGGHGEEVVVLGGSASRSRSPPPPSLSCRVPLRFRNFTEADFVTHYVAEQQRLTTGCGLPCTLCGLRLRPPYILRCPRTPLCSLAAHVGCLALWVGRFSASPAAGVSLLPTAPCPCPLCATPLHWAALVRDLKRRATAEERLQAQQRRARIEARMAERLGRVDQARRRRPRQPPNTRRVECAPVATASAQGPPQEPLACGGDSGGGAGLSARQPRGRPAARDRVGDVSSTTAVLSPTLDAVADDLLFS